MTGEAARTPLVKDQQDILNDLRALYAKVVEQAGASSPVALKLREMLQVAQRNAQLARRIHQQAVQRAIALRRHRGALWQLLLTMLAGGRLRKTPPFRSRHTPFTIRDRAPPWAPWCVLSPPAVPQLITRK